MKLLSILISFLVVLSISWPFQGCGSDSFKNATCTNTSPLKRTCVCNNGYQGDGFTCTAINACLTNNGGCSPYATCNKTGPDTRTCACKTGYSGDGFICIAINSCLNDNGGCSVNATCTYTGPGTRTCACNNGYSGDGVTCTPNNYQLTVVAGSDGTITAPSLSPITVQHGVATPISATPNTRHGFINWTVTSGTGVTFGSATSASTTVTLAGGDATIRANFTPVQYQLTVNAGSNGTITAPSSSPMTVITGTATTIVATPNVGYSLSNWEVVDGVGVTFGSATSASTTVTLTGGDATIRANFTILRYLLTVTAGPGGAITAPSLSPVTVDYGTATTINATPSTGYSFVNWGIVAADGWVTFGSSTSASTTVTLTESDATIYARFSLPITTMAGGGTGGLGDNGPATSAELYYPTGVAVDFSGNLFISEWGNNRVRKVDATSKNITTVAGNGTPGYSGDGGPATSAELYHPSDVAFDSSGNLYISDNGNNRIRRVDATSKNITTVAGGGAGGLGDNGPATSANLYWTSGVAFDSSDNLYIADSGHSRIRKVDTSGIITTVAGNGSGGYAGDGGPATSAELDWPNGVTFDSSGNLYITDTYNYRIRKVDTTGIIITVVGNGIIGYLGDGGPATSARICDTAGLAFDSSGNLYFADQSNQNIRMVDTSGIITTVAGNGIRGYSGDGGPATLAELSTPFGVAVDTSGKIYIADEDNNRIRMVYRP